MIFFTGLGGASSPVQSLKIFGLEVLLGDVFFKVVYDGLYIPQFF